MNRIAALAVVAVLTTSLASAEDTPKGASTQTGSSSADLRSANASTTGTTHGTGTYGHENSASTTGTLRGTGTMKKEGATTSSKDLRG